MSNYTQAAQIIINEQQQLIGPLANDLAKRVSGLQLLPNNQITITGEPKSVLSHLVTQYKSLFGDSSVDVCKYAIKRLSVKFKSGELPDILI